jgi:hypothetical protein
VLPLLPLALLLTLPAASTTIGPELVERFSVAHAGAFVIGDASHILVATGAEGRTLERRNLRGDVLEKIELPCAAIDVAVDRDSWAALCVDRVIVTREFASRTTHHVVDLPAQSAKPALLAMQFFHAVWVVAYEDGLVQRGRFESTSGSVEELDLRARPVSIVVSGISDATVTLDDGTRHEWRSRVEDAGRTRSSVLVEIFEANGSKRARVSRNIVSGSTTIAHTKHGVVTVAGSAGDQPVDALDVAYGDDVVCGRTGATLTCYGAVSAPPEIEPRAEVSPDAQRSNDSGGDEEFVAPLDFGTPGVIAALVGTALGTGAFASAPFVMQALSPSLGLAPAFALAGLGAVAGVASFSAVASVVIVVGTLIIAATPSESASANAGACAPGVRALEGAINECICAMATIIGVVGAVVATASVGVAALAVSSMAPTDAALTGHVAANDPFFATLGGAAAGSIVGFGVGALVSFATLPLRDRDEDPGLSTDDAADDDLAVVLDNVQTLSFVVGGAALGASIGYGLSRGP